MQGEIISMLAQATPPAGRVDEPVLREPLQDEVSRFNSEMAHGVAPVDAASAAAGQPASHVRAVDAASHGTLGDRILNTFQEAGREFKEHAAHVDGIVKSGFKHVHTVDLLRVHWELANSSLVADLVGKVVQKTTQHIDTLTKL